MNTERSSRAVGNWLLLGVFMLVIQIALGGITRLTGSGLSITQWDVITGALPPMNDRDWNAEFLKYQQTPQYHLLNSDFTLSNFKFIFFWEWFHRFWGRLIGIVFAIGFITFLVQKRFKKEYDQPDDHSFLTRRIAGCNRLDHGGKWIDRRCDLCKTNAACTAFYFCNGPDILHFMVRVETDRQ
jgi:heme A synthase